uniref:SCP extracellular domain containing protein n=1 Tax=Haemonchus contortus TaxID=6289 RepID=W6NVT1_HAECO
MSRRRTAGVKLRILFDGVENVVDGEGPPIRGLSSEPVSPFLKPQTGKPIYLGTAGVTGCNNDGDCVSVFNGTKCGPQGLCGYSFTTTTKLHSTTSTAPVTTPATEKATSGAATGTPSKAATASTKGTRTPSEASSASTQGTGASSKAASASTQGTEASSKAATASTKGTGTPSKASSASTQGTGASSKAATASTKKTGTPSKASSASTQGTGASSKAATASTKRTETPSKAASGSTKGTGASSKVATASTQETGASSKAATASTQGTGTPSKAASASTRGTGASSKAASTSTRGSTIPSAASTSISEKTTAAATTTQTVLTTTAAAKLNQSELFIELINGFREKVAKGDLSTSNGPLPSSLQMFQVEYSPELEVYAQINTIQCQTENFTPPRSSMNYYTFYETPGENLSNITVINLALASWMQEILNTNFGSQVTYTNQNMKDFANMIYYKSTKAGCAYQQCNQPAPPRAVVACIFNSAPQLGKPIYPGTQGVNGCNKDSDCSAVISGTTCGPQGLCGYSFSKFFLIEIAIHLSRV